MTLGWKVKGCWEGGWQGVEEVERGGGGLSEVQGCGGTGGAGGKGWKIRYVRLKHN